MTITERFDLYFNPSFYMGLVNVVRDYFVTAYANLQDFAIWNLAHFASMLTFEFYYTGYSVGKLARIFFFGEP